MAIVWAVAALFLIDVQFNLIVPLRILAMLAALGAVVWAVQRFTRPWLGVKETDLDMALLAERQQKIDTSDLVAALQFESPEAAQWGSTQLETAVIDYVADFSRGWKALEGFATETVILRVTTLLLSVAVVVGVACFLPEYASVFANRMALGARHYPTRTQIAKVEINGREVALDEAHLADTQGPTGQPIVFTIHADSRAGQELPASGRIEMKTLNGVQNQPLELVRQKSDDKVYEGRLTQLLDSLEYTIFLGDAYTDQALLEVIPLPVVEMTLTPTAPAYAQAAEEKKSDSLAGSRQLSVIEGSKVDLKVFCLNKKLSKVTFTKDDQTHQQIELVKTADFKPQGGKDGKDVPECWSFAPATTPLGHVVEPLNYQIQVVDEYGLSLEHPLRGSIRIKVDRKPTISAEVVMQHYLPTGTPKIHYQADDDYGLSKLTLHMVAIRQGKEIPLDSISVLDSKFPPVKPGREAASADDPALAGKGRIDHTPTGELVFSEFLKAPVLSANLPLSSKNNYYPLSLESLRIDDKTGDPSASEEKMHLKKDDQLKVWLEAVDYRGAAPGESSVSETIVLNITDESGVHAAIAERDEQSARQIDAILKLETGGSK